MTKPIYLDYNATTPHDPEVIGAMRPFLEEEFGNPSSSHLYGSAPQKAVMEARAQVADLLNCSPNEIIFTSGGTESNNHAIRGVAEAYGAKGNHIITSQIEHPAILEVCNYLEKKGFTSTFYHGGLSNIEKDKHFSQWLNNQKQVMVATNAFGMGIDKPDVKTVIHVNLPESIESYFQEAGRAGRNNKKAFSVILKNKGDEHHVKNQFLSILPSVDFIKQVYRKLCNYFQISYGEGEYTKHEFNLNTFCNTYKFNSILTYNALKALDRTSIITLTKQYNRRSSVQVLLPNKKLFQYLEKHQETNIIVKSILRTYGGIFDQPVKINTYLIADKASTNEDKVIKTLLQLQKDEVISLALTKTDAEIIFLQPREDDKTINRIAKTIEQQNNLKKNQVASVLNYVNNNDICKSVQLLSYFGESNLEDCGICSVCIKTNTTLTNIDIEESISTIILILKEKPLSSRDIFTHTKIKEIHLATILKLMLEKDMIEITNANTYKIR